MSSEPERPVEKLLRASAKERRDKAGRSWEIHPATRRLLQQEVARRFRRAPGSKQSSFGWLLGQWWLRPVGGLAALVVLVLAAWLFIPAILPKKNEPLLAKIEQSRSSLASNSARTSGSDEPALKTIESDNRA